VKAGSDFGSLIVGAASANLSADGSHSERVRITLLSG